MPRKMLKSLSFVLSSRSVNYSRIFSSSRLILSSVRFVNNGGHDKSSVDLEDKVNFGLFCSLYVVNSIFVNLKFLVITVSCTVALKF